MSVRKRTWKTPSGEPRHGWLADYSDQAGQRHQKTFARKKDADDFHDKARVEVRRGTHTADSQSITVAEAAQNWLDSCSALERATTRSYESHVRLHITPFLGKVKLSQLTTPMVREFEDNLRLTRPAPGQEKRPVLSDRMVSMILTSLGSLLGDAVERGHVATNVARNLRSKRKRGKEAHAERRRKGKLKIGIQIPAPSEIAAIIAALDGMAMQWQMIMLMLIFSGLRASELRGLRWSDLDLKKNLLHVRQRADLWHVIGPPKTEAGERTIPLPEKFAARLREWKLQCPRSELRLVFPTFRGKVRSHNSLIHLVLIPAQLRAGITAANLSPEGLPLAKYTGTHAFRHFYASWCINRRVDGGLELPVKIVQQRLGHASIVMTMDRYGHLFPTNDDGAELAAAEAALYA